MRSLGLSAALAVLVAVGAGAAARAQGEIKIGEINSYSGLPAFTEPYRKRLAARDRRSQRGRRRSWQEARRDLEG